MTQAHTADRHGSAGQRSRWRRHVYIALAVVGGLIVAPIALLACLWLYLALSLGPWFSPPRPTPLPALHVAVEASDLTALERSIVQGVSIDSQAVGNPRWPDGTTPLMIAVHRGDSAITKVLLDYGAILTPTNSHGESAIHCASGETIRILLDRGADIEARTNHGQTPLMRAAIRARQTKDLTAVRLLLERGADVNATDDGGRTALALLRTWPDPDPVAIKLIQEAGGR